MKKNITLLLTSLILSSSILTGCTSSNSVEDNGIEQSSENPPAMPEGETPPEMPNGEAPGGNGQGGFDVSKGESVETTGVLLIDGTEQTETDLQITSTESNESTIKVTNGGNLTVTNSTLTKASGEMTVEEASDFFGANSGVLVNEGSALTMSDTTVTTTAEGGNAIFSTGEGSIISLENITINTSDDHSRGLDATYNGTIIGENIVINTEGLHSAGIATDRGEGTITVVNATVETQGNDSPSIYSTGNITVSDSVLYSNNAEGACIEGKNSITLINSTLTGNHSHGGILMYQSTSGDAEEGISTFTMTGGSLTALQSRLFYITNNEAVINLENATLIQTSGELLRAEATSRWGKEGENGGIVTLNATNQILEGNVVVDDISSATINLSSNSTFTGAINTENSGGLTYINIDDTSTWEVTSDSYLSSITISNNDTSKIIDNGYTIYYDSTNSDNSWLNGETITLSNGGSLTPLK